MVSGFGLWASCILFRLLRLYIIFIRGVAFTWHWTFALLVLDSPFIIYSILLSSNKAIIYHAYWRACIYTSRVQFREKADLFSGGLQQTLY
jgi:hypothetical protein